MLACYQQAARAGCRRVTDPAAEVEPKVVALLAEVSRWREVTKAFTLDDLRVCRPHVRTLILNIEIAITDYDEALRTIEEVCREHGFSRVGEPGDDPLLR